MCASASISVASPRIRPRDPVTLAVLAALRTAAGRFVEAEDGACRGKVEGIHRLRTATRRLRSELRAFSRLVDAGWIKPLEDELKWLAGLLGAVRDIDVLTARLQPSDEDQKALAPFFDDLKARHASASASLRAALQGHRYRALLHSIDAAIDDPGLGDAGEAPCRKALPPLAASAWRRLKKAARVLRPDDPDAAFHEVRKRAKRARYTAEMVAPVLSGSNAKSARRFIRSATRVQDVLGAHQDAVVAAHELQGFLDQHDAGPDFEQSARRVIDAQDEQARSSREAFFEVWDKLNRKKLRRWLSSRARRRRTIKG